ncbi:3-phenylpropionate/cinnamic acid dioxygenase ferredoxin subunit [Novipirellula aureliae]|uniref:3-phenylpropionate/cinnamic acid dioxygenase ferredoxin subunit n=1 Tax=Novipirellula aureliae TaxID=2527966 RepID=A0A5C6EBP0_9BACT|nr:non-heme iron oxygenase ferredoxin subunit [Novipirellula aureliae]TWU45834.1 3-phenylpropionate/cinnamic acid dioxygenase ferredoxin subunit [Novipirellula aureliae]
MSNPIKVATTSSVPPGRGILVDADGLLLALFNIDGVFYAIDDACPHQGAPLSEGAVRGCVVICPWHAAEFEIPTGKLLCAPGTRDVQTYPVTIDGDDVMVDID